ncbi:MAG: MBL fold metallo-hydrolase [Syntrophomonadaceae bacterium]|nr:MBL fold metallo-hydrolase [Syntrophomonadaceae bacterium]MDD4549794.1 MBL fold metallo-hydrolase [Syntrophomonadaceae bacterium]
MRLTIIGCWSPFPKTGEACSGYLVEGSSTKLLIDCGHSVFSQLGKYLDYTRLDAVIISHFHPDHYADLYALRHAIRSAIYSRSRTRLLDLFIPGEPVSMFSYWSEVPEFNVIRIEEKTDSSIGEMNLTFYPTVHSVPGFGVKITTVEASLFYTGDTAYHAQLENGATGVDLLLAETTMLAAETEYAIKSGHMTTRDVGFLARKSCPGLLLCTHLWPGYSREQIETEIRSFYTEKFIMARCGMQFTI